MSFQQTDSGAGRNRPLTLQGFFFPLSALSNLTHLIQAGALIMQSHSSRLPRSAACGLDALQSFINEEY